MSRRAFLLLAAGAGVAAAAERGEKSVDKLIPYVVPPVDVPPGTWTIYATTCRECPAGCGLHVRVTEGRPIKAEGNPVHPISRGGVCARGQSCVQGLYDPDRLRGVLHRGAKSSWATAISEIGNRLRGAAGKVVVLSDLQTGALVEVMQRFLAAFGSSRLLFYEPFNYEPLRAAHDALFGLPVVPTYDLESSEFIISFGADFLETWASPVGYARQFAEMHNLRDGKMGRMAYVGPRLSMTAANADDFLMVPPGTERYVALAMLDVMLDEGLASGDAAAIRKLAAGFPRSGLPSAVSAEKIRELARLFAQSKGSVALAGPVGAAGNPATATAAAAGLLNYAAGRVGKTVDLSRVHALSRTATNQQMAKFLSELAADDVLIIHGSNPVYSLSGAEEHLRRAGLSVYLGTMPDETAALSEWVLPINSPLESWGDYEPLPDVHGLMQPMLRRFYDTQPAGDILLSLAQAAGKPISRKDAEGPVATFEDWLHKRWEELLPSGVSWQDALAAGGVFLPKPEASRVELRPAANEAPGPAPAEAAQNGARAALCLWSSPLLHDGRVSNRGWLQEAQDPTTSIVWGNWLDVNPKKALALGLAEGDVVELTSRAGKIEAPVRVTEDVEQSAVAISFGQGHTALGRNAAGRGANAFRLNGGDDGFVELRKTGRRVELTYACATQEQHDRKILQWAPLSKLRDMRVGEGEKLILPLPEGYDPRRDIYAPHEYKEHRWAMVIDLARCIGCGACAVACYAENNLAVVGEEQIRRGRQMAWLRIIPYRDPESPKRLGFVPLLCQHCDAAPCEPVCPVYASVHNEEGLNSQVYNRCIGTRYCSNNCPYKVRRFNWINITWRKPLDWQLNPEVTVRCRGVMEKCTFCIQRIRGAELRARREGRKVQDGEIKPACAQSCPTRAFVFGDLLDPASEVSKLTRGDPRRYHVLEVLNTKPAVTYLRRISANA